jgi:hypothetical protein
MGERALRPVIADRLASKARSAGDPGARRFLLIVSELLDQRKRENGRSCAGLPEMRACLWLDQRSQLMRRGECLW